MDWNWYRNYICNVILIKEYSICLNELSRDISLVCYNKCDVFIILVLFNRQITDYRLIGRFFLAAVIIFYLFNVFCIAKVEAADRCLMTSDHIDRHSRCISIFALLINSCAVSLK